MSVFPENNPYALYWNRKKYTPKTVYTHCTIEFAFAFDDI